MYVSVNGCNSDIRATNIGLPQGSVSAPWLFGLYVNDMHRASDILEFIHSADDTTIYMSGGNLTILCADECEELDLIDDWLKVNRLSLNIDKTCFMVHTHYEYDVNDCDIRNRNVPIKHVRETKFLGLKIYDKHNYNGYVTVLVKQVSRNRGLLFKLSYIIPTISLRHLYYALFYSRMTYGIAVWGGGNLTNASRIYKINRATINIFVEDLPEHIPIC